MASVLLVAAWHRAIFARLTESIASLLTAVDSSRGLRASLPELSLPLDPLVRSSFRLLYGGNCADLNPHSSRYSQWPSSSQGGFSLREQQVRRHRMSPPLPRS